MLGLVFWFDAGSDYNTRTDTLGQQSGVFDISEVEVNAGSIALPFVPKSFEEELRVCQRYYEKSYNQATIPGTATTSGGISLQTGTATTGVMYCTTFYKVTKRISPTVHLYDDTGAIDKVYKQASGKTANVVYAGESCFVGGTTDSTNAQNLFYQFTADAEL